MRHIAAMFLVAAMASPATAAGVTIGFDGITDFGGVHGPGLSVEQGVEIELSDGFDLEGEPAFSSGVVHLDDFGTGYSRWVELRFPDLAHVTSLDVNGLGIDSWYYPEDGGEPVPFAYDNMLIEGGAGSVLASLLVSTGLQDGWTTLNLDEIFAAVTWLRITAVSPSRAEVAGYADWECSAPCAHFEVDNVTFSSLASQGLTPVPLPASMPALGAGLGLLMLMRRRRRA